MNRELMVRLEAKLRQIQRVADGEISGDEAGLFNELLAIGASAGPASLEYALALRSHASFIRNQGALNEAIEEYRRVDQLLAGLGDEALLYRVMTLTSLVGLYAQSDNNELLRVAISSATQLLRGVALDPARWSLPAPAEVSEARATDEDADAKMFANENMVANLTTQLADSVFDAVGASTLELFDDVVADKAIAPAMRLAVMVARGFFASAKGLDAKTGESFDAAWQCVQSAERARVGFASERWIALGQLAVVAERSEEALQIARKLHEWPSDRVSSEFLSTHYHAFKLEAAVLGASGDLSAGEAALRKFHDFCIASFGRESEEAIEADGVLGRWLASQGHPDQALALLDHVAAVRTRAPDHPSLASGTALFDLGYCLDKKGEDTKAIAYYESAFHVLRGVVGPNHPMTVLSALNLAETARVAHDFETAERWFREVLELCGSDKVREAQARNNLAETLLEAGRVDEAAELAQQALELREMKFGAQSKEATRSLYVVARAALARGELDDAQIQISRMHTLALLLNDPETTGLFYDVRLRAYEKFGEHEAGIHLIQKLLESKPTEGRPGYLRDLNFRLGALQAASANWSAARATMLEAFKSETIHLSDECGVRSRRQVRLLLAASRRRMDSLLFALTQGPDATTEELRSTYEVIQSRKGIETRLLCLQKPSFVSPGILESSRVKRDEVNKQIERVRAARARWVQSQIDEARGEADPNRVSLLALQDRVEFEERSLAEFVGERARDWEMLGLTSAIPQVPKGAAVLEFVLADAEPGTGTNARRYFAFLLGQDDSIRLRELGDAAPINKAIEQLRTEIIEFPPVADEVNPPWLRRARYLCNRLLLPFLDQIADADRLFVIPDGELFTLPFDLLAFGRDDLAIDRWAITHLWHGGELGGFRIVTMSKQEPASPRVFAAPAFDLGEPESPVSTSKPVVSRFAPLPFAEQEGREVANRIVAELEVGERANKQTVLHSSGAEILHFATHSFYIPYVKQESDSPNRDTNPSLLARARASISDPMERCGIALTGADAELLRPTPESPGVLFASEVLDLDLRGTDMVVLSSCQSGLGDASQGDGIQGLRRAFRAAGTRSVVSSLWKVPDAATFDLMRLFYENVMNQMPRGQALRDAKLQARTRWRQDPMMWAGFVLDGDSQPLSRFSPIGQLKVVSFNARESQELIPTWQLTLHSAVEQLHEGRWQEALQQLEQLLASEGADDALRARAEYERAGLFRRLGRRQEALRAYDEMIERPSTPEEIREGAIADRALTKHQMGDLDGALLDYSAVLAWPKLDGPKRARVLMNRGAVQLQQDRPDQALADFDALLAIPQCPPDQALMARLNRADVLRKQSKLEESAVEISKLLKMPEAPGSDSYPKAFLIRALCRLGQGRFRDAITAVRRHMKVRRDPLPAHAEGALRSCSYYLRQKKLEVVAEKLGKLIVALSE